MEDFTPDLLDAITNKISEVTDIKYTGEDWGQLNDYDPHPPVKFPCALIDEQSASFSDIGMERGASPVNRQEGTTVIVITIATKKLTNTSHRAPQTQKDKAWKIHRTAQRIHEKLHGWCPVEHAGKLIRTGRRKVKRNDGIQQLQVTYTLGMHNV